MNVFYREHKSSPVTLITEQRATRLYLLLLLGTLSILMCYNTLVKNNVRITVSKPSQADFEQLKYSFGASLQCPCQQTGFRLKSFVQTNIRFHQICSSVFIELHWIMTVSRDGNLSNIASNEFHRTVLSYFTSLQTFCGMAMRRIVDTMRVSLDAFMISAELVTQADLASQIKLQIGSEVNVSLNNFKSQIEIATGMMQLNQILNVFSTNWLFVPPIDPNLSYSRITTRPVVYDQNCSCATSPDCVEPLYLDNQLVPGFVLACTPMEAFLRSTLICFYSSTCIQMIVKTRNVSNFEPLDSNVRSRFASNSTVKNLVLDMFIEHWSVNISYSTYFDQCQPKLCSYVVS